VPATLWVGAAMGVVVSVFWLSWKDVRAVHDLGPRPAGGAGLTIEPAGDALLPGDVPGP
jgi:hypothetical protein